MTISGIDIKTIILGCIPTKRWWCWTLGITGAILLGGDTHNPGHINAIIFLLWWSLFWFFLYGFAFWILILNHLRDLKSKQYRWGEIAFGLYHITLFVGMVKLMILENKWFPN